MDVVLNWKRNYRVEYFNPDWGIDAPFRTDGTWLLYYVASRIYYSNSPHLIRILNEGYALDPRLMATDMYQLYNGRKRYLLNGNTVFETGSELVEIKKAVLVREVYPYVYTLTCKDMNLSFSIVRGYTGNWEASELENYKQQLRDFIKSENCVALHKTLFQETDKGYVQYVGACKFYTRSNLTGIYHIKKQLDMKRFIAG